MSDKEYIMNMTFILDIENSQLKTSIKAPKDLPEEMIKLFLKVYLGKSKEEKMFEGLKGIFKELNNE